MDYEKKYKDALEKAGKIHNEHKAQPFDVMLKVFPELKESEDERIRKEIVDFICWATDRGCITKEQREKSNSWLAWLEKQGEKTPVDKIQLGKKYKCIASPRYSTFMTGKIYKPEDKFLCSLMNFCSDCFEPIEDGEQKPVEWSEEDEKMRKTAISLLTHPTVIKNNEGARKGVVEWLEHIKPPYFCDTCKLKKSIQQGWKPSEEQMEALSDINVTGYISYAGTWTRTAKYLSNT